MKIIALVLFLTIDLNIISMELNESDPEKNIALDNGQLEALLVKLEQRSAQNEKDVLFPNEFLKKCEEFKKKSESKDERKFYKNCAQTFLSHIQHKPSSPKKP